MSRRTHMQTTRARISQSRREAGHLFTLAAPTLEPCDSPFTPSPRYRSFAWQDAEDNTDHRRAWFTHSPPLQPDTWQAAANGSLVARLQRRPFGDGLQQRVSIERHLSRISPAHPRSLARCFSRARRHSAFCFGFAALMGFGFQKIFCAKSAKKISRTFRKSTPSALGSGAHSRRFAQECPEGNPGKSKQEKFQWHSTKTT
jgi:hypothetical protein